MTLSQIFSFLRVCLEFKIKGRLCIFVTLVAYFPFSWKRLLDTCTASLQPKPLLPLAQTRGQRGVSKGKEGNCFGEKGRELLRVCNTWWTSPSAPADRPGMGSHIHRLVLGCLGQPVAAQPQGGSKRGHWGSLAVSLSPGALLSLPSSRRWNVLFHLT